MSQVDDIVSSHIGGAKKRLNLTQDIKTEDRLVAKLPKFKGFSYDKSKLKRSLKMDKSVKIEVIVSHPMLSKDGTKREVVIVCFFNKAAFKTAGVFALLEAALDCTTDNDDTRDWVKKIRIVKKRKES